MGLLGEHLVGEIRAGPAARLTFAVILLKPVQATEPLPPERFPRARRVCVEGSYPSTRRPGTSSVPYCA